MNSQQKLGGNSDDAHLRNTQSHCHPPNSDHIASDSDLAGVGNPLIVVGIGASAGGVEALEKLFVEMPATIDAAFVIVQHLAPDFESLMHQILSRRTKLPVAKIENGVQIKPGHVYVLPNGFNARVNGDRLITLDLEGERESNTIDEFFFSLADNYEENAVGIVLSGTGSDGAAGLARIHEKNGLVIAQSESSAKFNGMPRAAIATGITDAILPVEEIPDAILKFIKLGGSSPEQPRHAILAESMNAEKRILQLLHCKFGIDFDYYKSRMFGRRLSRRMLLSNVAGIETYLKQLESDPLELKDLYNDMLIGVTEFFRDSDAFNELQHNVLPGLLEAAASTPSRVFRVWIAPCATGEEAYSVAILIDELISQRNYNLDVKIFATDVNEACINTASKGIYSEERLRNVSSARLKEFFLPGDKKYQIIPRLRRQIVFARQDLLTDAPFTRLDLVCCRNLLIYFNDAARKKVLSLFNFSLNTSGVLFLGPSESITDFTDAFAILSEEHRIYRKNAPVRFSQVNMPIGTPVTPAKTPARLANSDLQKRELSAVYDALLGAYMPPGILVNDENCVLHIFGKASELLTHREGRPAKNFFDLLPESVRSIAVNGLRRAKIEDKPAVYPGIKMEGGEDAKTYKFTVMPIHNRFSPKYLISFEEIDQGEHPLPSSSVRDLLGDDNEVINALEKELVETRESLHESILNLKSANEEMQTTNEELIASNEELQSTNEELHSVNEELYTVNSEHQRKITELTELTDDMDNLLDCLQIDTIYLDRHLRVRKFTLGIAGIFKLLAQDIGRDFGSFNHDLNHDNIIAKMETVLETEQPYDEEVEDKRGNWYLMRLLPYTSRGIVDGVLLTLIDISSMKETEQRLCELSEIVQSSRDAIFRVSKSGEIRTWNRGARDLFLHESGMIVGKHVDALSHDKQSEGMMAAALEQMQSGNENDRIELKASRRNGEVFDVHSTISPIFKPDGQLDGASIVLRDITTQKEAELQIREQVDRRDHFLAVLSHELRNPIAAIINSLSVVRREKIDSTRLTSAIDIIHQQSNQLGKMLEDLLHVSRVTHNKLKLQLEVVDIAQTASRVAGSLQHRLDEKQQTLTLELPDEPVLALVDETRVIQAQTNLLINASKYTGAGGIINYAVRQEAEKVLIDIADNGEGMSAELLERIFEVFVQAEQQLDRSLGGMGLGLPLVKMIANAHGGVVTAQSDGLGAGSRLRIELPVGNVSGGFSQRLESDQFAASLKGVELLLVEDNDGAREMLAEFLSLEGIEVNTAVNGIEAVDKFNQQNSQICVVDIGLPDLNGYEVAQRIRATEKETLLIALTGYGQEKDREQVRDAGFDMHFVKPMDPELLIEKISVAYSEKFGALNKSN